MSTSASGLSSMLYKKSRGLIPSEENSSHGSASPSTLQESVQNTRTVRDQRLSLAAISDVLFSVLNPPSNAPTHHMSLEHSTTYIPSHIHSAREHLRGDIRTATSSPVDLTEQDECVSLRVGIVIHRASEGFAARANTLHRYIDLNRHVRPFRQHVLSLAHTASASSSTRHRGHSRLTPRAVLLSILRRRSRATL